MHTQLRNFLTHALMPLAWRMNPQRAAEALKRFGDTEADSGWHYLRAMLITDDVQLKRMLFANAIEEFRHSDYFNIAAHQLSSERLSRPPSERSRLVQNGADLPYFLAYAHESERSIYSQFGTYARACGMREVSDVFHRIRQDEEEHESRAAAFLRLEVGAKRAVRLIIKAKLARMTEAWTRASQMVGDLTFRAVLRSIFLLYGAAMLLFARRTRPV
jgi:rubrerythrin